MKRNNFENGDLIAASLISFLSGGAVVCASFMVVGGYTAKAMGATLASALSPFAPQPTATATPETAPETEATYPEDAENYGIKEGLTVETVSAENTHKAKKDASNEKK